MLLIYVGPCVLSLEVMICTSESRPNLSTLLSNYWQKSVQLFLGMPYMLLDCFV